MPKMQYLSNQALVAFQPNQIAFGSGLEYQTSKEGSETALPLAFEYGITGKLTALVEPVVFTWIRPDTGAHAVGLGDLEISLFYQLTREKSIAPSISLAAEVKLPTTQNALIGSGKVDYTPFLVITIPRQLYCDLDLNGNLVENNGVIITEALK
jgi:hypothetical protein